MAVIAAVIAIPGYLLVNYLVHQAAANEAAIQAHQAAVAAALRHDAELVHFGQGTPPGSRSVQIVIENRSPGWVRNMTLIIPVPERKTPAAGGTWISVPDFSVYGGGGNGFQGVTVTAAGGAVFREPLTDLGPCELGVTTAARSFPTLNPATLVRSELDFTDPNGVAWRLFGSGKLVRNTSFKGRGVWSPYSITVPLPGCVSG